MTHQSPIFVRTYDLLQWLLPHTSGWPRHYRFTLTQELVRAALRFQERIFEASLTDETAKRLEQADVELRKVRLYRASAMIYICLPPASTLTFGFYDQRLVSRITRISSAVRSTKFTDLCPTPALLIQTSTRPK